MYFNLPVEHIKSLVKLAERKQYQYSFALQKQENKAWVRKFMLKDG